MENRINELEKQVAAINERNRRVEAEKAWEVNFFRISLIAIITYFIAAFVLHLIGAKNSWLNALVPTVGYILSTQSLPFIKKWWISNNEK